MLNLECIAMIAVSRAIMRDDPPPAIMRAAMLRILHTKVRGLAPHEQIDRVDMTKFYGSTVHG